MRFINQIEPVFGPEERDAVMKYMESGGWLTEFKKTREFEEMLAKYLGIKYCSFVFNGTVSLMLALAAIGIKKDDEVIVPDYTFVASATAVEIFGAKAVFVDIEKESLCMDFNLMKEAISDKTKAIMLVSMNARYPKRINDFVYFCKKNNIWLIEDAAQSLGSTAYGKFLGTYGDIGSFSFSMPKIISTGQGGAVVTNNDEIFEKMKKIRNFGRESPDGDHFVLKGWNFKVTDLQAVIGMEQLKKLDWRIKRKKEIGKLYYSLLKEIPEIELIPTDFKETALCAFDVLVKDKKDKKPLMDFLKEKGIGTRSFYPPLHSEPAFDYEGTFPITEDISARGLWLPSSVNLSDNDVYYIVDKIAEFFKK
ncbi:MAG: DegT/DnrJ/EryC1/StrS family aminotransferase [Candidatus Bilamarchaeaceae archaeon]